MISGTYVQPTTDPSANPTTYQPNHNVSCPGALQNQETNFDNITSSIVIATNSPYGNNESWTRHARCARNETMWYRLKFFCLETNYDYATLTFSNTSEASLCLTGTEDMQQWRQSNSELLTVSFYSDGDVTRGGFELIVECANVTSADKYEWGVAYDYYHENCGFDHTDAGLGPVEPEPAVPVAPGIFEPGSAGPGPAGPGPETAGPGPAESESAENEPAENGPAGPETVGPVQTEDENQAENQDEDCRGALENQETNFDNITSSTVISTATPYRNNESWTRHARCAPNETLWYRFNFFCLEYTFDFATLIFANESELEGSSLAIDDSSCLTGNSQTQEWRKSNSEVLIVSFYSDGSVTDSGFELITQCTTTYNEPDFIPIRLGFSITFDFCLTSGKHV